MIMKPPSPDHYTTDGGKTWQSIPTQTTYGLEQSVRARAKRQGLIVKKSRTLARQFRRYQILDTPLLDTATPGNVVLGAGYTADLWSVAAYVGMTWQHIC